MLLFTGGAFVDARDQVGATALHRAMELDDVRLMSVLLRAGARTDLGNEDIGAVERAEALTIRFRIQS